MTSQFEKEIVILEIRPILTRISHSQTIVKLKKTPERFKERSKYFKDVEELIH